MTRGFPHGAAPGPIPGGCAVTVRHNFEAAHRLPALGGKCVSLHGHSWWLDATFGTPADDPSNPPIDFGQVKSAVRHWVDKHLDHATLIGESDPLLPALTAEGCKVYRFGHDYHARDLAWPTVEAVAVLAYRTLRVIAATLHPDLTLLRVRVQETHTNAVEVPS
jgi:6-pyruvoyltetrahydropterin/6-carboxytetrahydropterin synthase